MKKTIDNWKKSTAMFRQTITQINKPENIDRKLTHIRRLLINKEKNKQYLKTGIIYRGIRFDNFNQAEIRKKMLKNKFIINKSPSSWTTNIKKGEQFAELTAKKTSLSLSEEISENKIKQFDI